MLVPATRLLSRFSSLAVVLAGVLFMGVACSSDDDSSATGKGGKGGSGGSMAGEGGEVGSTGGAGGGGGKGGTGATGGSAGRSVVPRPTCGDAINQPPEGCDDGNTDPGDGCSVECRLERYADCPAEGPCEPLPVCGDGIVNGGEQCDDGNHDIADGCSGCKVDGDHQCTDPAGNCRAACGDGTLIDGEECDDGNHVDGDGCSGACLVEPECSSGAGGAGGEAGSTAASGAGGQGGAACSPVCGDAVVTPPEQCDDGTAKNDGHYGGCTTQCKWAPFCGDGIVNGDEACDRGAMNKSGTSYYGPFADAADQHSCTVFCTVVPHCGDGIIDGTAGEECDDGDQNKGVGPCLTNCTISP